MGSGGMHVVGMLILLNHAENLGKRPLLRYPETYLHPRIQTRLADLVIYLSTHKISNFKTDEELCKELGDKLGVKQAYLPPIGPYQFRCISEKCWTIHDKSPYCVAQQAMGNDVTFTCPKCGITFDVPEKEQEP